MVPSNNFLIPTHRKLDEKEVSSLLEKYSLDDVLKLPKISIKDAGLAELEVEVGDVVEITRVSFAGENTYFRVIIE